MSGQTLVTVYGLRSSDDGRIRYVGQTKRTLDWRLRYHLLGARRWPNRYISKWITAVLARGARVIPFVIESDAVENEAEKRLISWFKAHGARLVNGTDGGEGVRGYTPSMETREKLRVANLGKKQSEESKRKRADALLGRSLPEHVKRKMSEVHSGKKCPWISERNMDPEWRERARLARIARWAVTPKKGIGAEGRAKLSAAHKGRPKSEATRKRMSEVKKEWWAKRKEAARVVS